MPTQRFGIPAHDQHSVQLMIWAGSGWSWGSWNIISSSNKISKCLDPNQTSCFLDASISRENDSFNGCRQSPWEPCTLKAGGSPSPSPCIAGCRGGEEATPTRRTSRRLNLWRVLPLGTWNVLILCEAQWLPYWSAELKSLRVNVVGLWKEEAWPWWDQQWGLHNYCSSVEDDTCLRSVCCRHLK